MSGMPAWGKSMSDEYIWNMAAFLQQLPDLDEEQYKALVATSGGHSHGGGETQPHEEPAGVPDDHSDMPMEGMPMDGSEPHVDPPGPPPHDDGDASGPGMKMAVANPHPHAPGTPPPGDQAAPPPHAATRKPVVHRIAHRPDPT